MKPSICSTGYALILPILPMTNDPYGGSQCPLLLWKRQLRTLARGTGGLVEALDEER